MPSFTLRPNGNGAYAGWAGHSYTSLSDASDTTYMNTNAEAEFYSSYTMADLPADAGSISGDVTWHNRNTYTGDAPISQQAFFRYSSTNSLVGVASYYYLGGIGEATAAYALAPGSAAWTPAILNATEIGCYANMGFNDFLYCYDLWATGTYLQSGAFFVSIYNLVGPVLVGANLLYREFAEMVTHAQRQSHRRRIIFSPDEVSEAWREYKDRRHKHPRHFDLRDCYKYRSCATMGCT